MHCPLWKKEEIIYGKYLLINVHEICDFLSLKFVSLTWNKRFRRALSFQWKYVIILKNQKYEEVCCMPGRICGGFRECARNGKAFRYGVIQNKNFSSGERTAKN